MQHTIIPRYYRLEWERQTHHIILSFLSTHIHTLNTHTLVSHKPLPPTALVRKVLITLLMITLHTPTIKTCSSRAQTLKSPCSPQQLYLHINSDVWSLATLVCVCVDYIRTHTHQLLQVLWCYWHSSSNFKFNSCPNLKARWRISWRKMCVIDVDWRDFWMI